MDGTTTSTMDTLMSAATDLVEFSGQCLNTMIENPVYAFMFAGTVVGVGLYIVRQLKKTAKH